MPPKHKKLRKTSVKNKSNEFGRQTSCSNSEELNLEDFREYQLAKWCRPHEILDGAQLIVDKTDDEFDRFISHFKKEPAYQMLVASFSVVQVFQKLNQQIENIHRQVIDVENFEPDQFNSSKKQQALNDEINHIEHLKQAIKTVNDELIRNERAYCNSRFFDPGNYLTTTVNGCSGEGSDLTSKPVNLYALVANRAYRTLDPSADLTCFYSRIRRVDHVLSRIKEHSHRCPKISFDVLCSYIEQVDQLSKNKPDVFRAVQAYPWLQDMTGHYNKVNNASAAILVPSETIFLQLFQVPRKQPNCSDPQWLKEVCINLLIAIFLASINDFGCQGNAKQLEQYVFSKERRQHFSPRYLYDSLEHSRQRLNKCLQVENAQLETQKQQQEQKRQQQQRLRIVKEQAGAEFLGRCFNMQQRYSIVRQMFDDALEDAIFNHECDYLTWPLSNQIQQIELMARHIACVDSYEKECLDTISSSYNQTLAIHDTSQIQHLSHDVDEVLQKLDQDRKDDSINNLGNNITFFNSVNRQVSTVISHLNKGELSLEDLGGQLISNSSPCSTSPTK